MAKKHFVQKYLCFGKDLTLATRLIAFVGIIISAVLVTVLLNDLSAKNFDTSRKIAASLGLDWRHFHPRASAGTNLDPKGKMITSVVVVYALLFFLINVTLLLAAILEKPTLAIPWLTCEFVGCLSKLVALVIHFVAEVNKFDKVFVVGSCIYILVMSWFWAVVYSSQSTWSKSNRSLKLATPNATTTEFNSILLNSPEVYHANSLYASI
ncbi:hypothetical protein MTP99_004940 [Tenebrio molitor]|nr:hypothetical protein MTP99_004940 [Tenebrio molitor]